MEPETQGKGFFGQFKPIFWVVNTLEGFERGAYYGTIAVLSWHVFSNLFPNYPRIATIFGLLYAMLLFLLYFTPLIAAALAEKYGYKKVLLAAFFILVIGYFLLYLVRPGQLAFLAFALFVMGIGAGAFKPIISATIAHVTEVEQRNTAYAIYYWSINLGATCVPLFIAWRFPEVSMYYYVFLLSAILITINLMITIVLYKSPVTPQFQLSVPEAIKRIIPALQDKKFVLLLAIYSGFWFMFAIGHTFLPVYMMHYHRMPSWFLPPALSVINPFTIIVAGPFLAKFVEKYKSLNVVMVGIMVFCTGLAIIGFSNSQALFVTGIVVFSFGEFITHPGFIAHVSKIAPKKMVAIYMACIFLSTGSGNIIGGIVQGMMYDYYGITRHMPQVYFALIISVGLITFCAFILYNRWMIKETLRIEPRERVETGIFTKVYPMVIALVIIPVVISSAYSAGPLPFFEIENGDGGEFTWADYEYTEDNIIETGETNEGSDTEVEIAISKVNLITLYFNLTWTDEPDLIGRNNQPDSFSMEVIDNDGKMHETKVLSSGRLSIKLEFEPDTLPDESAKGTYQVIIKCHEAGNQEPIIGGQFGVLEEEDPGNNWNLDVEYSYYAQKQ